MSGENYVKLGHKKMDILHERLTTYIFISVGILVLRLFGCRHITIGAVVLTVVIGSAMVRYNHQLLDVSLENVEKLGSELTQSE